MMQSGDTKVRLLETECELRPVPAMDLLQAREMQQELGLPAEASGYRRLVTQAYLLAAGVYANGERLFASGEDVLQRLTAEAASFAGSDIGRSCRRTGWLCTDGREQKRRQPDYGSTAGADGIPLSGTGCQTIRWGVSPV